MSEPTALPLDESKLPFKIPQGHKAAGKIMKLGQMITDRVPAKLRRLTVEDPEYWGLASIVTDEMADVALKMKVRQPMTLPELEKATGKPAKELEPLLYQMSCVGLLEYNWENPRREKQYILPMFVPGSAEFFNMNKQQIADHPEVTAFFERMTFLPLEHITAMVPPGGAGIGMHVIPVEKSHRDRKPLAGYRTHLPLAEKNTRASMPLAPVPAVCPAPPWAKAAAMTRMTGASAWAIWRTIWWKPTRAIM